jgi:hypothetical protein
MEREFSEIYTECVYKEWRECFVEAKIKELDELVRRTENLAGKLRQE